MKRHMCLSMEDMTAEQGKIFKDVAIHVARDILRSNKGAERMKDMSPAFIVEPSKVLGKDMPNMGWDRWLAPQLGFEGIVKLVELRKPRACGATAIILAEKATVLARRVA